MCCQENLYEMTLALAQCLTEIDLYNPYKESYLINLTNHETNIYDWKKK